MKLWLGDTALHELARHLQIIGQSSAREPAEAPQRERRTVRVRLEFREDSYLANAQLVAQVRGALKTPTTTLRWEDDSGAKFAERWVIVGDDDQPENDNAWGTHLQAITFSFFYFLHDLTTNCLPATLQRKPSGTVLDLGAILKWSERLDVDHFDEQRDPRRRVMGVVSASGRWQGNTAAALAATRDALLGQKNTLLDEVVAGTAFQLTYGTGATKWDKTVRVQRFVADVDQPSHCIEWSLTATFTRTPAETDYAWMDYEVTSRETKSEGIISLGLRGRIGASSRGKAVAKLATLTTGAGAIIPVGYVQLSENLTDHQVTAADGDAYLELIFDLEYRDTTTETCTVNKTGNATLYNLGTVERFADRYQSELFDSLRPHRKRVGGLVSLTGKIFAADTLTLPQKQTELAAKKVALDALFNGTPNIDVIYGSVFAKTVRVVDWDCAVNRFKNCLEWSLAANYTRYPNEADYAIAEFRLGTKENKAEGTVNLTLAGRIGAPNAVAARDRLTRLRAAVIPAGYVLLNDTTEENAVSLENNRTTTNNGDGDTFIQLDFNEEFQKVAGDILTWSLRITDNDDTKSGFVVTTYSGSVSAKGNSQVNAWTAALTQAETLGKGKYPFQVRSTVTEVDRQFQTTGGVVFVTVEFSYEYQRKGSRVYLEVTAERNRDAFGQTTETVTGYLAAPTLAAAAAAYLTDVRNLPEYAGKLLLSERTPTKSQQTIKGVSGADQFDRYAFGFTVFIAKTAGETAMRYDITNATNLQTLENVSTVSGTVYAAGLHAATEFLDPFLSTLALGNRTGTSTRKSLYQTGPAVTGSPAAPTAFLGLEFSETYVQKLTGLNGILECEVAEQVRYSGRRLVEKPIPGSISLFQETGTTPAQRVVTGRVKATTEVACLNWAKKCRSLLLTVAAQYEEAPVITTSFKFLPQADGTVRGVGADVLCFESSFEFKEFLPELPLT